MVLETTLATVNRMLYKIFKTFLLKLQSAFKYKESKNLTENVDFYSTASRHFVAKLISKLLIIEKRYSALQNNPPPFSMASLLYSRV